GPDSGAATRPGVSFPSRPSEARGVSASGAVCAVAVTGSKPSSPEGATLLGGTVSCLGKVDDVGSGVGACAGFSAGGCGSGIDGGAAAIWAADAGGAGNSTGASAAGAAVATADGLSASGSGDWEAA